jgi:shikimate kinase
MKDRICLIGYRGTGKTTIGPLLAQKLGWGHLDADVVLEAHVGIPIRDYFARHGEPSFRSEESRILRELLQKSAHVISTGGGVVVREDNRKHLKDSSFNVWLEAQPETIQRRLEADPITSAQRPNLAQGGLEEIRQMLANRQNLYAEVADLRISTDELFPEHIVDRILEAWAGK